MSRSHPEARARGFSLVEVMVAVVVICVGLLGIAKMQALSLSNMTTSRQRALAAIQAASFASAMHSNREYWGSFGGNFSVSVTSAPTSVASTDAALQAQTASDLTSPNGLTACVATAAGIAAVCNATQLAAFDLARWWVNSLTTLLPNPGATVSCPPTPVGNPTPVSCTIQITWSERPVALNAQASANGAYDTPTYVLYVQP